MFICSEIIGFPAQRVFQFKVYLCIGRVLLAELFKLTFIFVDFNILWATLVQGKRSLVKHLPFVTSLSFLYHSSVYF